MKILLSIAFAGFMLAVTVSDASAWYCRAQGNGGSGWGRSDNRDRALVLALGECAKRARNCRIQTCTR
jgi:hypothetical protein